MIGYLLQFCLGSIFYLLNLIMADGLYPPHSRLFIACGKETTEEELTNLFKEYGTVANVNLCRDRESGAAKGKMSNYH